MAVDKKETLGRIGENLRTLRCMTGLSLVQTARKSGGRWTAAALASYERGSRAVSVCNLIELAEFYGVPAELLFSDQQAIIEKTVRLQWTT